MRKYVPTLDLEGTLAADAEVASDATKEEKTITKTITVRRDLDMSGLSVKEKNIYPTESHREGGSFNDEIYFEIGTEETKSFECLCAENRGYTGEDSAISKREQGLGRKNRTCN